MRKCQCGCTDFRVDVVQEVVCPGIISFSAEDEELNVDDPTDVVDSHYDGPFVCCECGQVYGSEDDIPKTEEEE